MRTVGRREEVTQYNRVVWASAVAGMLVAGLAVPASAALTTSACLAKKLKEWGTLRKCQAIENGRALQAKPADPTNCQTKFARRLAAISEQATLAAIACRYGVNGDGTATDYDTGLMWEQKTADGSVHDTNNRYTWSPSEGPPEGTAFTSFLATLNNCVDGRPYPPTGPTVAVGGFAGHCDWRLPSVVELQAIVDLTAPNCRLDGSPCIDQAVFGPTVGTYYWSATVNSGNPNFAWFVYFDFGFPYFDFKDNSGWVRAVRSGL